MFTDAADYKNRLFVVSYADVAEFFANLLDARMGFEVTQYRMDNVEIQVREQLAVI